MTTEDVLIAAVKAIPPNGWRKDDGVETFVDLAKVLIERGLTIGAAADLLESAYDAVAAEFAPAAAPAVPAEAPETEINLDEWPEELLNARVRFWLCPDDHPKRKDDKGWPLPTVEWRGHVAHCLEPGCGKTSAEETTEADAKAVDQ